MTSSFKSGFIAIVGAPNVGKSSLLNALIGEKVSIITPKPQTTRNRIVGIKNFTDGQLIFLDTPGIHQSQNKFNMHLVETAQSAFKDSDLIFLMVEATQPLFGDEFDYIRKIIKKVKATVFLIINKIDLVDKKRLLPLIDAYRKLFPFQEIIPVSALTGSGLERLEERVLYYIPEGPRFFPDDVYTSLSERFLVAEIIREKVFFLTRREIPYSSAIKIKDFKERADGVVFIHASILVEKKSQKGIIIGKQGKMLKEIGKRARHEIEKILHCKVYLDLWVTVKKNWTQNETFIKQLLAT